MEKLTSKDGTAIAFDRLGSGPAVILVGGVLGDHYQQAPLADLLAPRLTVYNYDRRGRGQSGLNTSYSLQGEIEDLDALIHAAGGSASVYGTSGLAILALEAAAQGLPFQKMALWEPPYVVDNNRPPMPPGYRDQLQQMLDEGRRGDMVEFFLTTLVGMPAEFVAPMRTMSFWPAQEAAAHTLLYDTSWLGDYSLPRQRVASVKVPTLVLDGGLTPWLTIAADAAAQTLPNAQRRTLPGQPHNVDPTAIAPVLIEFFSQ